MALSGCGGDSAPRAASEPNEVSHEITTPSGPRIRVTAAPTTARESGRTRPAVCGNLRGLKAAGASINDEFCVYPEADRGAQAGMVYGASNEPDLRIVAAAPPRATGIRLRAARQPPLTGEMVEIPGANKIQLALLTIPASALPGAIELVQGEQIVARARLRTNPCKARGQAEFTCQAPLRLTVP